MPPKPVDPDTRSEYRDEFRQMWTSRTRHWFHEPNVWPYVVDTRRTVDPDFEVTLKDKKKAITSYNDMKKVGLPLAPEVVLPSPDTLM